MQVGLGFMGSKALLSAVELDLFTVLAAHPLTAAQIGDRLALHPRGLYDFLDVLLSMKLLERQGDGHQALYQNTPETAAFLDKNSPAYVGGFLEMAGSRLYPFWANLSQGLRTGEPQNEIKHQAGLFEVLYSDEPRLEQFLRAMQGFQMGNFLMLAEKINFTGHRTFCDVGGANGTLASVIARRHPHLSCISFDLPIVAPVARRHIEAMGADARVVVQEGDFFKDPLPEADVVTMGNILHDWDEDQKQVLIRKAYQAVPPGGMFIAIENVIDDARRSNTVGLLVSLNMLIETRGGFDYTGAQFAGWCQAAGFQKIEFIPLTGATSAAIAYK
ncbi:methyltransferase domain-containing protein [bacterium]|nr:methyltransferase domain-containing protein [bacterium]